MMISKEEAQQLLEEFVPNKNLQKHMYAVAQAMSFYAKKLGEDEEKWWVAGLLHDADYEKYPDKHPYHIAEYLEDKVDQDVIDAILGHATYTGVARETKMAKILFAVDELTGFIVAVALIKPSKSLDEVDVESVKKRFKEKRFAAGVNREDIAVGAQELGVDINEHIQNVIDAMKEIQNVLGL
jgi:predicted hydrolase (HD superfamily)